MCTEAPDVFSGFFHYHPPLQSKLKPTNCFLAYTHTSFPAAAAASFPTPWFPPATGQAEVRTSSVSPNIRPMHEVLLQKLTVHHKTSCNRRWVVKNQAERPSAHGGVREIFLSLSMPGQSALDWHRALLMKEDWGKHQKLSWGQNEEFTDTRRVAVCL